MMKKQDVRNVISWIAWPGLLALCLLATAGGFAVGHPIIVFNLTYFALAVTLLLLERWMPHEKAWQESDGQLFADIAHTLVSKGTVQTLVVFSGAIGLAAWVTPMAHPGHGIWPRHWPLAVQVVMGVTVSEFGLYWAHHIAHKWRPLWRFHAVHHSVSVKKLYVINTGRFHFVDFAQKHHSRHRHPCRSGRAARSGDMAVGDHRLYRHPDPLQRLRCASGWLSVFFNTPEASTAGTTARICARATRISGEKHHAVGLGVPARGSTKAGAARRSTSASRTTCPRASATSWSGRSASTWIVLEI